MASYNDPFGLPGLNDTVICPYNTSHVVGVSRMQQHLVKCRKKNPEKAKVITICAYNQSHHVPQADMSYHLQICRDFMAHRFQTVHRVDTGKAERLQNLEKAFAEAAAMPAPAPYGGPGARWILSTEDEPGFSSPDCSVFDSMSDVGMGIEK